MPSPGPDDRVAGGATARGGDAPAPGTRRASHGEGIADAWVKEVNELAGPALAPASRVGQLDSVHLDGVMKRIITGGVKRCLHYAPDDTVERLHPEIEAVATAVLLGGSVWRNRPTPGQVLQKLRYAHGSAGAPLPRARRWLFVLIAVVGQWAFVRGQRLCRVKGWHELPATDWRKKAATLTSMSAAALRALSLVNLFLFIRNGAYVGILERVLSVRMVATGPRTAPTPAFEYLNRLLVWNAIIGVASSVVSAVDWGALATGARRLGRTATHTLLAALRARTGRGAGPSSRPTYADMARDPAAGACASCTAAPAVMPYAATCGHVFCYFCIHSACIRDKGYRCPRCSSPVASADRL